MRDESLATLANSIQSGSRTAEQVTRFFVDQQAEWPGLNAFNDFDEERLIARAAAFDANRVACDSGALGGVPVALKDNIVDIEFTTRCASKILGDFTSFYDAFAVERLKKAGALCFGKTNMDEFAMGSSGENSAFGVTRNPWTYGAVPGGSSSGSAAAVAAGLVPAALGSDTGGSIRQPAAFCGVVGMKPSYGRVSRRGLVAYGSSLDQIGPITRTVDDAALLYSSIAGFDAGDSTSAEREVEDVFVGIADGAGGLTIGLPSQYFGEGISDEVRSSIEAVASKLKKHGAKLVDVELPHTRYAVAAYYILATAEASSNLSRFDGVRYGHRAQDVHDVDELYSRSRAEGFGPEVIRRILLGAFVLSSGYYDAYYRRAQQVRRLVSQDFEQAFTRCDVLLTPTTPTPAFGFGRSEKDPIEVYLEDVFTVPANLAGLPGISVPASLSRDRLPIGVQFLAPQFDEAAVFRAARAWEDIRGPFERPSASAFAASAAAEGASS